MGIISDITNKFSKEKSTSLKINEDSIKRALSNVMDPDLHRDIVSLGFVRNVKIEDNNISLDINLTTPACPVKDLLQKQAIDELEKIPGVGKIHVTMTAVPMTKTVPVAGSGLGRVKNIIAVASGKGGVGKSTTTLNISYALSAMGASVGVLDADIYGPSIPHLTGVSAPTEMNDQLVVPPKQNGIKMISVSMFSGNDQAQILRGPMAGSVIKQFLTQVDWGELDYLLIDYPPGTGDIQLTISQVASVTGAVIVTTPQETALIDVRKAISMFNTMNVPVVGIVENMSYFVCDGCDKKHYIFKTGGGRKLAEINGLPLLGELPLESSIVEEAEQKRSIVEARPESVSGLEFKSIAGKLAREISILVNNKESELSSFSLNWRT